MKIYAPVKSANGIYASVRFVDGVGETDNPRLIEWFRSHGYRVPINDSNLVIEPKNDVVEVKNDRIDDKPNFDEMTPLELREWARANGFGSKIKNTRDKEKLLKIIRG